MIRFLLCGYTTFQDNQDIITGFVIEDMETHLKTKVSVGEAIELSNKGDLELPNPDDVVIL